MLSKSNQAKEMNGHRWLPGRLENTHIHCYSLQYCKVKVTQLNTGMAAGSNDPASQTVLQRYNQSSGRPRGVC